MKKITLFVAIILFCTSCNDDDKNSNPVSQLPPETQSGANTVGCLVNGAVFLPYSEGANQGVNCFYQFIDGEFYFALAIADLRGDSQKSVNIFTAKINLSAGQTYLLNQGYNPDQGGGAEFFIRLTDKYSTNLINSGELKITRVDLSNSIISGTFWFDAVNAAGEEVEIREGRFDWNY